MRVPGATARAAETGDVALAHDAVARLEARHALADGFDHAAPLVARNDREANPARIEDARDDVEVGAADAGSDAPDANVPEARRRRLDLAKRDGVRLLDHDGAHGLGVEPTTAGPASGQDDVMRHEQALTLVRFVVEHATAPVSVFVADGHGELVAAATMDGAAPDTRLNAQRKAYTAARSDARSTAELADKAREDAAERASFDPFFTFFQGGVAVFEDGRRVGAIGVSGLAGSRTTTALAAGSDRSVGLFRRARLSDGERDPGDHACSALTTATPTAIVTSPRPAAASDVRGRGRPP